MNRQDYFNSIEKSISWIATSLEIRGSLNLLDLNLYSEDFYLHFINLLFDWELINLNTFQQNTPSIDLVDNKNNIVVQVSATATKWKIESSLSKDLSLYRGYTFKFIAICKETKRLRTQRFRNPSNLKFSPSEDILDVTIILSKIKEMHIDKMKAIYEFVKKEIHPEPDLTKVETNLANIINILSNVDLGKDSLDLEIIPYDIENKISYNQLDKARVLVDDYKIHYHRIDKIYSDYDKQGANKSLSILNGIRKEYISLGKSSNPDEYFFKIIDKVTDKIKKSSNYRSILEDELSLCVEILVVDAFIRCKIFENPKGNIDAGSR